MNMTTIAYLSMVGLALGSFAGCLAFRYLSGGSVLSPARSYCPKCNAPLRWFENIPILSYCLLRGRCRSCGQPIGAHYLLMELTVFISGVALALFLDSPVQWVFAMAVSFLLIVSAAVEVKSDSVLSYGPSGIIMTGVAIWVFRGGLITSQLAMGFGVIIVILSLCRYFCTTKRYAPEGFWALMVATAFASSGYMDITPVITTAILAISLVAAALMACVKPLRKFRIPGSAVLWVGFVATVMWA